MFSSVLTSNRQTAKRAGLFAVCATLGTCVAAADSSLKDSTANLSTCDIVHQLIEGHANGFQKLRGVHSSTKYADIWKATYDVIGSGCEVWRSGKGEIHYVCTRSAPDKLTADDYYDTARTGLRSCLGPTWQESEQPRKLATGVKITFTNSGEKAAISIHEIKIDGLLRDQWTIYYIVGEPNDKL